MSTSLPALDPRRLRAVLATGLLALAALATHPVQAQPAAGPGPMRHHPGMMAGPDGGFGPGMMMGPRLGRLLDTVKATDAQKAQIRQIAEAARRDLAGQHDAGRTLHQQALQLFAQPTLDAAAVESLRQKMAAQHDQASRRMAQAMLEIGQVLTPEQRRQLVDAVHKRAALAERHARERLELQQGAPRR